MHSTSTKKQESADIAFKGIQSYSLEAPRSLFVTKHVCFSDIENISAVSSFEKAHAKPEAVRPIAREVRCTQRHLARLTVMIAVRRVHQRRHRRSGVKQRDRCQRSQTQGNA